MPIPERTFSADVGQFSVGTAGPDQIEYDFDNLFAMLNPGATLKNGSPGGVGSENMKTVTLDLVTVPDSNEGNPIDFLSRLAYMIKAFGGQENWFDLPATNLASVAEHMEATSGVHGIEEGAVLWTDLNDGHESGLDADLLDGNHASAFALSEHTHAGHWTRDNDGSGSGLDADLLDGIHASSFARVDEATNFTIVPTFGGYLPYHAGNVTSGTGITLTKSESGIQIAATGGAAPAAHASEHASGGSDPITGNLALGSGTTIGGYAPLTTNSTIDADTLEGKSASDFAEAEHDHDDDYAAKDHDHEEYWSADTDGAGSGLDADLLDGKHASWFAPAEHTHAMTGYWTRDNDGAGSGLDADLLDGLQATAFALATHDHATQTLRPAKLILPNGLS